MTGLAWAPELYQRHAGARLRPALELLARVPLDGAATVVDLGCGAGALLPFLRRRFPGARLTGIDLSASMLAQAAAVGTDATLLQADAATWRPEAPVDLIIANAVLHWLDDHPRLIHDLLSHCRVLAVQVPDNFTAPAYLAIRALMAEAPWAERLAGVRMGDNVLPPEAYCAILQAAGRAADVWQTTYQQQMAGPDAVLDWLRATTLLPVQAALGGADAELNAAFEAALRERLRAACPADATGGVRFAFRRLFVVASEVQSTSSG